MKKAAKKRGRRLGRPEPEPKRPTQWEKRVVAAYLRMLQNKQASVAAAVGVSVRTVQNWEAHKTWADARAVARERWMSDVDDASNATILVSVRAGNVETAKWFKERTDDVFAPRSKHEHTGAGGGPIETRNLSNLTDQEVEERAREAAERLAELTGAHGRSSQ